MKLSTGLKTLLSVTATLATLGISPVQAAPGNPTHIPNHPRVNQVNRRFGHQGGRIRQGIKNGTVTSGETQQLHTQRTDFKQEEHAMRASDDGHLTHQDQAVLNHQENQMSHEIYQDKHPDTPASTSP